MSAVEDVQKSLNAIRRISGDANSLTQHKILELILQTSISHLKALAAAHKLWELVGSRRKWKRSLAKKSSE